MAERGATPRRAPYVTPRGCALGCLSPATAPSVLRATIADKQYQTSFRFWVQHHALFAESFNRTGQDNRL